MPKNVAGGGRMRAAGERVARQAAEPQPDHYNLPLQPGMTESDEEVVSNSCCGSVLCGSPEVQHLP